MTPKCPKCGNNSGENYILICGCGWKGNLMKEIDERIEEDNHPVIHDLDISHKEDKIKMIVCSCGKRFDSKNDHIKHVWYSDIAIMHTIKEASQK